MRPVIAVALASLLASTTDAMDPTPPPVASAIERAGDNGAEIARAHHDVEVSKRRGMAFLLQHMSASDLRELPASFLLDNVALAYEAIEAAPWRDELPREIFLNEVLPYAFLTEAREPWRKEMRARCLPIVAGATSPSEAAARLNRELFPAVGVVYSQERSRTDQNVRQVLEERKATCTGLSILLAGGCRSVGVPARLVGVPLWPDSSGNHTWVEIWDDGWHFTGGGEPTGDHLDDAWFVEKVKTCRADDRMHAIYATSHARTDTTFPIAWDPDANDVWGVNVTRRYTGAGDDDDADGAP